MRIGAKTGPLLKLSVYPIPEAVEFRNPTGRLQWVFLSIVPIRQAGTLQARRIRTVFRRMKR